MFRRRWTTTSTSKSDPGELRIDVYRASGAGGQHVNRTESAVRITHLPTNIVVQCQNDRSQHKNKATAMKQLKARLYEHEMQKRRETQQAVEDDKADIGWGSQIRSYVLDQSRIKDLRTGVEIGNTGAVLDGDIDRFIEASLQGGGMNPASGCPPPGNRRNDPAGYGRPPAKSEVALRSIER